MDIKFEYKSEEERREVLDALSLAYRVTAESYEDKEKGIKEELLASLALHFVRGKIRSTKPDVSSGMSGARERSNEIFNLKGD